MWISKQCKLIEDGDGCYVLGLSKPFTKKAQSEIRVWESRVKKNG